MNWEAIAAIGEIAGALGVIATLAYLSIQLRQNTKALHASSYEHWNTIASSFSDFTALYGKQLGEIQQIESVEELSADQFYLLMSLLDRAIVQVETAFLLNESGNMDDDVFESRIRSFINFFDFHNLAWDVWDNQKHTKVDRFTIFIDEKRRESRP